MERLSALDAGFLELENDRQQLHVGSLLLFGGPAPAFADFTAHVESRLDSIPRYRQRVQRVPLDLERPVWVDDPHFQLGYHLRHTAVPAPGGEDQLRALFARVLSQRLDRHRPLWELRLVEGLSEQRWAVITKTHHAMTDGLAGGEVVELLMDPDPERSTAPWAHTGVGGGPGPSCPTSRGSRPPRGARSTTSSWPPSPVASASTCSHVGRTSTTRRSVRSCRSRSAPRSNVADSATT